MKVLLAGIEEKGLGGSDALVQVGCSMVLQSHYVLDDMQISVRPQMPGRQSDLSCPRSRRMSASRPAGAKMPSCTVRRAAILARPSFQRSMMQQGTVSWTLIAKMPKKMGTGKAFVQVLKR